MKQIIILVFLSSYLYSGTTESSTVLIPSESTSSNAGALSLIIDANEFAGVSNEAPVYIEFTLPEGVIISKSLVGPGLSDINLAGKLEGGLSTDVINLSAEDVRMVRCIEGESSFWIGVFSSTDTWLSSLGGPFAPDPTRPIKFFMGITQDVAPVNGIGQQNSASTVFMLNVSGFSGRDITLNVTSYDGRSTSQIGAPWDAPIRGDLWRTGVRQRPVIAIVEN